MFSLNVYHKENNLASYRCMDTHCKANGNIEISLIENKIKIKDFKNIKKHTLFYEEHNCKKFSC